MDTQQDLLYKIALTHLPSVGAVLARNLVGFAGGVEAVFKQKKSHLLKIPGIGAKTAEDIVNSRSLTTAGKTKVSLLDKWLLTYRSSSACMRVRLVRTSLLRPEPWS